MFPPKDLALWCSRLARQPVTLEVDGSSPFGVAIIASVQSFGSARYASVAQLVEQRTENPRVVGSIPTGGTKFAGVAHPVERHLAKVEVASSSLVTRSIRYRGQVVRQESAKLSFASSNLAGTSKTKRTSIRMSFLFWKNRASDLKIKNGGVAKCIATPPNQFNRPEGTPRLSHQRQFHTAAGCISHGVSHISHADRRISLGLLYFATGPCRRPVLNCYEFAGSRLKTKHVTAGASRTPPPTFLNSVLFRYFAWLYRTISSVPQAMRTHPRMERRVSCSWSSTAARMMVITTLSLSMGTTFDTSPI